MTRQFEDVPQRRSEDQDRRHDCTYESNGLRCKYPGAISHSTVGGGPYFCRVHIRERGTLFARQALEASQRYRPPPLVPELDPRSDPWLVEHFPMRPDETRQEYDQRCKAHALSMLGTLRVKPVVGFGPQRQREPGEDLVEM